MDWLVLMSPKVTLLLINYNYADFVSIALESILNQTYQDFECIVVDNNSSDESRHILEAFEGRDERLRFRFLSKNLNQMGALLHVLDDITGDYLSVIDADDFILRSYVAYHVQAHLMSPGGVAATSGGVLEVDDEGRVLSPASAAFLQREVGIRLSTTEGFGECVSAVSDAERDLIRRHSVVIPREEAGWHWSPGTANMYRVEYVRRARPARKHEVYVAAIDNYYMPFVHALGGSTCIDLPLSCYRIHGKNRHGALPTLRGLRTTTRSGATRSAVRRREITETLVSRPRDFYVSNPKVFWNAMDAPAFPDGKGIREYFSSPEVLTIISDNFEALSEACGKSELLKQLRARMTTTAFKALMRSVSASR